MAEGGHLNADAQKQEFELLSRKPLVKGETWYVVEIGWFHHFKKFIGLDPSEQEEELKRPGAINNSALLLGRSGELKDELREEEHFVLVHEIMWQKLVAQYGLFSDSSSIPRKVIEYGRESNQLKVEVYELRLKLCLSSDMNNEIIESFSESDSIETLKSKARSLFKIPETISCKLWVKHSEDDFDILQSNFQKLSECGIFKNLVIVLDCQNPDGSWTDFRTKSQAKDAAGTSSNLNRSFQNSNAMPSRLAYSNSMYGEYGTNVKPGLCGLCNLGNTCFMNSVLQLMSNTPPITQYFLSDRHLQELNLENPIGMYGDIAKSFGDLIHQMWSGSRSSAVPSAFKMKVAKFAPQFSGYQQHDSQELLTFLLDGLHEDLNRIRKKPYIEQKDADGRDDREVAKEAWHNYQKRNDSIIVDLFHGLLKSTVICPECNKISVTFDPFCYLSVPLPIKKDKSIEVKYYFIDPLKTPVRMKVVIPKIGCVKDLCDSLSKITEYSSSCLIVTRVSKGVFYQVFQMDDHLDDIGDKEDIRVFEVQESNDQVHVAVYLKEPINLKSFKLFGSPFFISVPKVNCSYQQLYNCILESMSRYFKFPNDNVEWWNSSTDSDLSNGDIEMTDDTADESEADHGYNSDNNQLGDSSDGSLYKLFNIKLVTSTGNVDIQKLTPWDPLVPQNGQVYIAVEYHPKAKNLFYDDVAAQLIETKQSCLKLGKRPTQLQECLELYTTREKLGADNAWYCSRCKKHQQATKKFDLWSLPNVLVIHLKRFSYTRYWRDKLDSLVTFPIEGLDMSKFLINDEDRPVMYDLIGVCNHIGGMGGGHYTSYAKNKDDKQWYCFDDNHVSQTCEDSVISKAAYVLFYMRRGADSLSGGLDISSDVHIYNNAMDTN